MESHAVSGWRIDWRTGLCYNDIEVQQNVYNAGSKVTKNYHFSCYRTQQDEGETIVLESDSNGLKAAIKYLEDNFYVGNLQWRI